jgi:hypothetical protein
VRESWPEPVLWQAYWTMERKIAWKEENNCGKEILSAWLSKWKARGIVVTGALRHTQPEAFR